ncbi:MAG: hypothetical protein WCK86_05115 [Planctomycetia bacterium]
MSDYFRRSFVPSRSAVQKTLVWLTFLSSLLFGTPFCSQSRADQLEEMAKKAGIRIIRPGDSTAPTQKSAGSAIPLNRLSQEDRKRAAEVIQNCNQFRRLPSLQYSIDEPIYRYLLEHPDVAVSTWRVMGISQFEMWQTGPMEFEAAAVDGSEGLADILYRDESQTLFICEGSYHHLLLPRPLQASALIWFRAEYQPHESGTHVVTQHADVFVHFPSAGVAGLAKVLTPVTNSLMDRNIFEVSLYASLMSRGVRDEPEWIVDLAEDMQGVLPQRKGELIAVARQPRQVDQPQRLRDQSSGGINRRLLQSPQLLFMDPPKQGSSMAVDPESGVPVITISDLPGDTQESATGTSAASLPRLRPVRPVGQSQERQQLRIPATGAQSAEKK